MIKNSIVMKDIKLMIKNRTAVKIFILILITEIVLVIYSSHRINSMAGRGTGVYFTYLHNHLLLFYMPVTAANLLVLSFSMTMEKSGMLLAMTIPYGRKSFLRGKVFLAIILSSLLSFPYLISVIYFGDIWKIVVPAYFFFLAFSLIFTIMIISTFSIFFSSGYFDGTKDYSPDARGILFYMLFIVFILSGSFALITRSLKLYYEYFIGYRRIYPNVELLVIMGIVFIFVIITRMLLYVSEKKDGDVFEISNK